MVRHLSLVILLLTFFQKGFAQLEQMYLRKIDSVQTLLVSMKEDTFKVRALNELCHLQYDMKQPAAMTTADQAQRLAMKLKFDKGVVEALANKGVIAELKPDLTVATRYYQQAIDLAEKTGDYATTIDLHNRLFNVLFYIGNYPYAMRICLKSLALAEAHHDQKIMASRNNLLGFIYHNQGNEDAAEKYYQRYLQLARQRGDSNMVANAHSNLADIFLSRKEYDRAFSFLFHALDIYTSTLYWDRMANTCFEISQVYSAKGECREALRYMERTMDYVTNKVPPNQYELAGYCIHLGKVYLCLDDFKKAIVSLRRGLNISRRIKHREDIKDACYALSEAWRSRQQYDSAYWYYQAYAQLKDSLMNERTRYQVSELHTAYGVEKNRQKIKLLNQQMELKESNAQRDRLVRNSILGFLLLLVLVFFLLYNRYRLKQKNKLQEGFARQQSELFNALIVVQDNERKRIAEDLHDGLGSMLSLVKLNLERVRDEQLQLDAQQREQYNSALVLLDETVQELRNVAHNIMPPTLSRLGLIAALRNLFDSVSTFSGIRINFITHGINTRLHDTMEINLYRVVLEIINNAVKHAQAKEITVQLIRYDTYINITCEDNGKGFEYERTEKGKGIGLSSVISRVGFLNGSIDIDSGIGKGTTVMIEIPISAQ